MSFYFLSKSFLTTLPDHIGVYVTVFFILFMLIAAVLAFPKNIFRNVLTMCIAVASAWLSFVFCDFIYDTLMQYESVKSGIAGILEFFPELTSSQTGLLAVSKYVVSLVAVPILFLLLSGVLNLGFKIAFLCKKIQDLIKI